MDGGEIYGALLELAGADSDELGSGEWLSNVRDEECGERDIKGEEWFNAMCHVEQSVAGRLASGNSVCPECMRGDGRPF